MYILKKKRKYRSQEEFVYHHCKKKRSYKSIKSAKNDLKRMKKNGWIVENDNAYKCKFCNRYHLGHKKNI